MKRRYVMPRAERGAPDALHHQDKSNDGFGTFTIIVDDARDAIKVAKDVAERGIDEIEICDEDGTPYDLAQLYHIVSEGELLTR